jgi:hypothetical protein
MPCCSRRQFSGAEVILRRDAERIGDTIEKCKHCGDVDGFCDLFFFPACYSKFLNILGRGAISGVSDQLDVIQQGALRRSKARFVKLACHDSLYALIRCSLDPQEVGVAV